MVDSVLYAQQLLRRDVRDYGLGEAGHSTRWRPSLGLPREARERHLRFGIRKRTHETCRSCGCGITRHQSAWSCQRAVSACGERRTGRLSALQRSPSLQAGLAVHPVTAGEVVQRGGSEEPRSHGTRVLDGVPRSWPPRVRSRAPDPVAAAQAMIIVPGLPELACLFAHVREAAWIREHRHLQ